MSDFQLRMINDHLCLVPNDANKGGVLLVDFNSEQANYRRRTAGIKQEIAKSCGVKTDFKPNIFDATAGLGGDAFVLASLGCCVEMVERNEIVHQLLADGIRRALLLDGKNNEVAEIVRNKLRLHPQADSLLVLESKASQSIDCVYLDPMFPQRSKAAKVKKAMQYFHDVVGFDDKQEAELLNLALDKAIKRVTVKRSKLAPYLAGRKPNLEMKSKTLRYDIYMVEVSRGLHRL